jgi:branched-chain amino acid transport system substrate-binding protein
MEVALSSQEEDRGLTGDRALSRRQLLRGLGAGAALVAGAPLLAACGSSKSSSGSSATTTGGSSSATTTGGSSSATSGAAPGPAGSVADIAKFYPIDTAHSGKGLTLDVGLVLAFTGPGAFFGRTMSSGAKIAVDHIEALGGPKFNLIPKDHKSGDPAAGVAAAKELGFAHVPMMLASYVDDLGAMLPLQAQYKIFTLDGGGGTSTFGQGKPYFWGTRAITPNDTLPGVVQYLKEKLPNVKKVTVDAWDLGQYNAGIEAYFKQQLGTIGVTLGKYITTAVGATDYSTAIEQIKNDSPDMVMIGIFGNDVGNFMRQYVTSGINKPIMGFEYTLPSAQLAGPTYDNLYLAFDYFNAEKPDNGWSSIFINEFNTANGVKPDYYAANYYEDMFALWTCVQRTLAAGGDPKNGVALNSALVSKPSFASVYGGDATTAGTLALNLTTHSVSKRPMTLSQCSNGSSSGATVTPLAYFDIDGADYHLA